MKLLNFSIIQLTIFLILGIIIGYYIEPSHTTFNITLCALFLLVISLFILKDSHQNRTVFSILAGFAMVLTGICNVIIHDETLKPKHYLNSTFNSSSQNEVYFTVKERLKPNTYNEKYIVELFQFNSKPATGQLLLNLKKDSIPHRMSIGDTFMGYSQISEIQKPKNPFQFDYSAYLKQRHIHHQFYTTSKEILPLNTKNTSIYSIADNIRTTINDRLISSGFKGDVLAIINALLLGQRQDMSPETYSNYKNSGTVHILAVSGLHVGILFIILSYLLKPIERFPKGKAFVKPLLIVIGLWVFAIIAGLSPSVTRAVTMFTIVAIAQHLNRPTNIYNTLAISAFLILLFEPAYVFDVGFQMSYLAVFAIVSLQPLLYKLWQPKYFILDKPWQILTVTVAAQLGVAPISLYYFHQFPSLFFVSNLVVIPFLGLILGFGLLVIILSLINSLPLSIVKVFKYIIETLNSFIAWVAQFEDFLFKDISFNGFQVVSTYLIITYLFLFWKHKTFQYLRYGLLSIILFLSILIYTKFENSEAEFVIFNNSKHTLLGNKYKDMLLVYTDTDSLTNYQRNIINNYVVGHFIKKTKSDSLQSIYTFYDQILFVIDSNSVYKVKRFKPDIILLRQSPKLNLSRLIDSLQPKTIVADASNYTSYVERWKATCIAKKIPFHSTYEKGAFVLK